MLADTTEIFMLALFIIGTFGGSLELALLAIGGWLIVYHVREDRNP